MANGAPIRGRMSGDRLAAAPPRSPHASGCRGPGDAAWIDRLRRRSAIKGWAPDVRSPVQNEQFGLRL